MLSHNAGRLDEAESRYRQLLGGHSERHFASVDAGIAGHKARHNLAIVLDSAETRRFFEESTRQQAGVFGPLAETLPTVNGETAA